MRSVNLTKIEYKLLAVFTALTLLVWTFGVYSFVHDANAVALTNVSDTLSDSDLSALATHTIGFTTTTAVAAGETIKIQLDPATSAFTQTFSTATTTDITVTGMTLVDTCGGGGDEVTAVGNYNDGSDENLTFTVCAGDTVTAGAKTVTVGAATLLWANPAGGGSYIIRIAGTMTDSADTRVMILDDVVVTANVGTSLTFTVAGLVDGIDVNGDTTSTTSTAVLLDFGTLASGTPVIIGQQLTVATNAKNGFSVTVQEDQPLQSQTGAQIDLFLNGATTTTPIAWQYPSAILDQVNTYGHFGITSEDSDLNSDEFGSALYAGNFDTPREIFSHDGPADGETADKGLTQVGFKIEITDLQEAGDDYTNTLWYVATPIF